MEEIVHGISGGVSGVVALSVWYPLDILRLRQQAEILNDKNEPERQQDIILEHKDNNNEKQKSNKSLDTSPSDKEGEFKCPMCPEEKKQEIVIEPSFFQWLKKYISSKIKSIEFAKGLIKREGPWALYKGISSALVGIVVTYGIYFYAYKSFKNMLIKNNWSRGVVYDSLVTSFLAACASSVGSNPIWVLNTRMAKAKKEHADLTNWQMIKQIIRDEGLGGFFKGVLPALILTCNPVIQFVIYEFLRAKFLDSKGNISGLNIVLISIISKLVTTITTYPILTVKTLFQANENKTNQEIFNIIFKLMKDEGIGGFYKGRIINF
jgi:solute carrier family 25 (peroxisomal adenine nucleotide transporter), member 17